MAWPLAVLLLAVDLTTGRASAGHGPSAIGPAGRSGPKVSVDEEQHDFGKSDVGVGGHHAFVFTNAGDEPLVLTRGKSTCGCCTCVCTVRVPEAAVAPGESADVTLEWQSKLFVGSFRQTAAIWTNDPNRRDVTLSITGRFTGPVGVVPSQVACGSVRVGQSASCEVRLYNYLQESLDVTGYELSNPQIAENFEVTWEPLSAEQVREEGAARSGYLVRIAVRPGLAVGAFQQGLTLTTTAKSVPRVDIPVQGTVVSDISIVGQGWNAQSGVLTMGSVQRSEGANWSLLIVLRGPHAKDIQLKPLRTVPESLAIELEPAQYIAAKEVSLTRLKIRVPPGSEPSLHWGEGRGEPGQITIQTVPPLLPNLEIRVRFAIVEGSTSCVDNPS